MSLPFKNRTSRITVTWCLKRFTELNCLYIINVCFCLSRVEQLHLYLTSLSLVLLRKKGGINYPKPVKTVWIQACPLFSSAWWRHPPYVDFTLDYLAVQLAVHSVICTTPTLLFIPECFSKHLIGYCSTFVSWELLLAIAVIQCFDLILILLIFFNFARYKTGFNEEFAVKHFYFATIVYLQQSIATLTFNNNEISFTRLCYTISLFRSLHPPPLLANAISQ